MDDELSLPPLAVDSPALFLSPNLRKRARLSSPDISLSSDPPLFSSDGSDDDPSADDYTNGKRKKTFRRGPWYDQGKVKHVAQRPKRTLSRQKDSGVYMGSDGTDVDDVEHKLKETAANFKFQKMAAQTAFETSWEERAEKKIELLLDTGNDDIDLSYLGLKSLSKSSFKLLSTFTSVPSTGAPFQVLEPHLKLNLSLNSMVKVQKELFDVPHIHMLSLRANDIKQLPSSISQLQQLVELNIANNFLQFLPFEILELVREGTQLRRLNLHPNPFYEPDLPICAGNKQADAPRWIGSRAAAAASPLLLEAPVCWKKVHRFSSPITYFNITGNIAKGPKLPADDGRFAKIPVAVPGQIQCPPGTTLSAAPSLLEVGLRACYQSTQLPYLAEYLNEETPAYFPDLLRRAQTVKQDGGQKCTICGREFLITRTEWIEWWEISPETDLGKIGKTTISGRDEIEALVPLIRRGCSWKCYTQPPN